MTLKHYLWTACAMALAGCQQTASPDVTRVIAPTVITAQDAPTGTPGQCYGEIASPVETKLVEQTIKVRDATFDADGNELTPAIYRRAQTPVEVAGPTRSFARLCDDQLTPTFVETLQRALQARGLYLGQITGDLDEATREAIRGYQEAQGLDSDVLSVSAAQQLGLVAVDLGLEDNTELDETETPTQG